MKLVTLYNSLLISEPPLIMFETCPSILPSVKVSSHEVNELICAPALQKLYQLCDM